MLIVIVGAAKSYEKKKNIIIYYIIFHKTISCPTEIINFIFKFKFSFYKFYINKIILFNL